MRIVHISTSDTAGGAARAAFRLHTGLRRLGHESTMLVARRSSSDPHVIAFQPPMNLLSRLRRKLRRRRIRGDFETYRRQLPAGYEPFADDRTEYGPDLLGQIPDCDLINLHWISGFLDYQGFFQN